MEEQPETPKILEELSRSNSAKPASRQQSLAKRRFIVVLLVFSLLVAGVVGLGYQQWTLQTRLLELTTQNQELSATLVGQDNEIEQLRTSQALLPVAEPADDSGLRDLQSQFDTEVVRLRQQLASLQQQQRTSNNEINLEWKILEAEYLLGIANQKLQLEADPGAAMALLEAADSALLESGGANVFPVRQAIAADVQLLGSLQAVDREGIYVQLDGLIAQVEAIDLLDSMRDSFATRRAGEAQPGLAESSSGVVDSSLKFLGSIFVWRKWDETPVSMLSPGQDNFVKQNLRLLLEQTQLALMLRDNALYQRSLSNSIDWLRRYSAPDSIVALNLRAGLEDLLTKDIDPPLPSLDKTLLAISQITTSER